MREGESGHTHQQKAERRDFNGKKKKKKWVNERERGREMRKVLEAAVTHQQQKVEE